MDELLEEMFAKYPCLETCRRDIVAAFDLLLGSFRAGGKVLVCGNGGSAADAEHICGELLKKILWGQAPQKPCKKPVCAL